MIVLLRHAAAAPAGQPRCWPGRLPPSRELHGQFPDVPRFALVGEPSEARTNSESLPTHRPLDLPAHGKGTEVTHTLFGGEPGARGTRRASGRVPLVELPRQRA